MPVARRTHPWLFLVALTIALGACSTAPVATPTASPSASVAPSATTAATPTPAPSPSPTAVPTPAPTTAAVTTCALEALSAAIVAGSVSNAAGGLVGFDVTVQNVGAVGCTFHQMDQVKMVDKNGVTMIAGPPAAASALLFLNVGASLKTTIQARNFCGGVPVEPVSVVFVLPGGGTIRAKPLATNPGAIVPSCFQGGIAGSISMSEWGP